MKNILRVILFQGILYLVQFIMIPVIIFPDPRDDHGILLLLTLTTLFISVLGMSKRVDKLRYWIMSMPVYYGLIHLYCPQNLYGIGYYGDMFGVLESTPIIVVVGWVLFIEICVWLGIKTIKWSMQKKNK